MDRRFLIIGASGFLGSRLYAALGPARALATYALRPVQGAVHFDIGRMRLRDAIIGSRHDFTHAFLLGGITKIDACAADPVASARINVDGYLGMIDDLVAADITPIYASSDAVYNGNPGIKSEEAERHPILTYGKQKMIVEDRLRGTNTQSVIVRLAKVVGTQPGDGTMPDEWLTAIEARETILCASDQVFSPIDVDDVVSCLIRLAELDVTGTYNVGGPRPLTRLQFLQTLIARLANVRDIHPIVTPCSIRELPLLEPRPLDTSMTSALVQAVTRIHFRDMNEVCDTAIARRYSGPHSPETYAKLRKTL